MPKYRIDGQVYEAASPEAAYKMAESGSIVDPLLQGATFGFSDELGGFGSQIGKYLATGEWDSDQYYKGRDEQRENLEAFAARNPKTALAAEIGGNLATAGLAGGVGKAVAGKALASAPMLAQTLGTAAGAGAAEGALYGAGTAEEDALAGAIEGGLTGAVLGAGTEGGAKLLGKTWKALGRPMGKSREAMALEAAARKQGVDLNLTAGQMADDSFLGNLVKGVESTADRIPGADKLLKARGEAVGNWNLSEIRQAMPDNLSKLVTTSGPEGMEQARKALSMAYEDALSPLAKGSVKVTDDALDTLSDLQLRASDRLPVDAAGPVRKDIDNLFEDLFRNKIDGANIKRWESEFGTKSRTAGQKGNIEEAKIYDKMLGLIRDQRDRMVGPDNAKRLKQIDAAYAKMIPIREASSMQGAVKEGSFTPSQLLSGAQKGQRGWGKATVRDPMGKRALAAENIFGSTVPQVGPGTAERMATQAVLGGLGTAGYNLATGQPLEGGEMLAGALATPFMARSLPMARKALIGKTGTQRGMRKLQKSVEAWLETLSPQARRAFIVANSGEE